MIDSFDGLYYTLFLLLAGGVAVTVFPSLIYLVAGLATVAVGVWVLMVLLDFDLL